MGLTEYSGSKTNTATGKGLDSGAAPVASTFVSGADASVNPGGGTQSDTFVGTVFDLATTKLAGTKVLASLTIDEPMTVDDDIIRTAATSTFTFGNTEHDDVDAASITLTDVAGTSATFTGRNDTTVAAADEFIVRDPDSIPASATVTISDATNIEAQVKATATIIGNASLDDEDDTDFILRNADGSTVTFTTDPTLNFGDVSADIGDTASTATIIGTADLAGEDGTNFILTNADGSTVTFHTDPTKNFGDTSSDGGDHTWELNTGGDFSSAGIRKATQALWIACKAAIDASELDMTISPTTVDTIADGSQVNFTLTQTTGGTAGNKAITLVTGVTASGETAFTGGFDGQRWRVNTRDISGGSEVRKATQAVHIACLAAIAAGELDMTAVPATDTGTQTSFVLTQTTAGTAGNTVITLVTGVTADGETAFTGGTAGGTHTIALIATDTTVITATADISATTSSDTVSPTFAIDTGSNDNTAANLTTCLNASSKLIATRAANVVTITQTARGTAGNTTITLTDPDSTGMSKTNFTGGTDGSDATTTADNFVTAVNANGINITASNVGAVVTLSQDTAGLAGNTAISVSSSPDFNALCDVNPPSAFTVGDGVDMFMEFSPDSTSLHWTVWKDESFTDGGAVNGISISRTMDLTQAAGTMLVFLVDLTQLQVPYGRLGINSRGKDLGALEFTLALHYPTSYTFTTDSEQWSDIGGR